MKVTRATAARLSHFRGDDFVRYLRVFDKENDPIPIRQQNVMFNLYSARGEVLASRHSSGVRVKNHAVNVVEIFIPRALIPENLDSPIWLHIWNEKQDIKTTLLWAAIRLKPKETGED